MGGVLESTARQLTAVVARAQADQHIPSLAAAVLRDGQCAWSGVRGAVARAEPAGWVPPSVDTQYRIGSVTKTMTAALVLQLRDRGLLDLGAPVGDYLPEAPYADRTVRSLLSHSSGMPAEPAGSWWERSPGRDWDELVAAHRDAPAVLPPGRQHHYSNLGFAVLGRLAGRLLGTTWAGALRERITEPLGMSRTTVLPQAPHAMGLAVDALAGTLTEEPLNDTAAMAPAGQLWSTVGDLVRWMAELASPGTVLDPGTVDEMATPQSAYPEEGLTGGYGLGLRITGSEPMLVGHTGSMPGFVCGMFVDRDSGVGAVLLTNAAYGVDVETLPRRLVQAVLHHEPPLPPEWRPTTELEPGIRDLLGPWYWGQAPFTMSVQDGELRLAADRGGRAFRFRRLDTDRWLGLSGYHTGETLTVHRRPDGGASHLEVATFIYTRTPYDPQAPIPGGPPAS